MENMSKFNLTFRLVLIGLLLLSFAVSSLAISQLVIHTPEDYIFSLVVVIITITFGLFELVMTLIHIKRPLAILKIGVTERRQINPIPLIAVGIGVVIALGFSVFGTVMYFVKSELVIKCNALVILSIGFFLLINCVFYITVILLAKRKNS